MGSLKRLTAVFLAVLMLASLAVVGVYADDGDSKPAENVLKINTSSNFGTSASESYDISVNSTVTVSFKLKSGNLIANTQGYITYDSSMLEISDFTLSEKFPKIETSTVLYNKATFNSTDTKNSADFSAEDVFATATFKILSSGETDVALTIEELNALTPEYETLVLISDSVVTNPEIISGSAGLSVPEIPTETTEPTQSTDETQPTQPAKTKISLKAAKSRIYVGSTTTVTAKVTNKVGKTTFTSSNKKVATVSSSGKVKGIKEGTVTITAKNNNAKATVRIKVVKKANPMTVKTKTVSAKAKKTTTISKSKAFTIKKAQGRVTFKKSSGDKKITINKKTGKITVKKGLKKGKTYKLKVKVTAAGNTKYKASTKTVTVKIKVK